MEKVYKIYHSYSINVEKYCVYIASKMNRDAIADIVAGLQFYLDDNSKYAFNNTIDEDIASDFLCRFYNCKIYNKNKLNLLKEYNYNIDEIDLYYDVEVRTMKANKCIKKIKNYLENEYIKKLKLFFNDRTIFYNKEKIVYLTPKEILDKY